MIRLQPLQKLLMQTLKTLLDKDVPLERILPAFTSNVADILRLRDRGRIQVGNAADLVALDENDAIEGVMIAGQWHVHAGIQKITGQFEKPQSNQ